MSHSKAYCYWKLLMLNHKLKNENWKMKNDLYIYICCLFCYLKIYLHTWIIYLHTWIIILIIFHCVFITFKTINKISFIIIYLKHMIAKLLQRNLSFFSKSVQVDYCFTWSFKSDFVQLKKQIQSLDPSITVNGSKAFLRKFLSYF